MALVQASQGAPDRKLRTTIMIILLTVMPAFLAAHTDNRQGH